MIYETPLITVLIADEDKIQQAIIILRRKHISSFVEEFEPQMFRLSVQLLHANFATNLLGTNPNSTGEVPLVKNDNTIIYIILSLVFVYPLLLLIVPHYKDPLTLSILFILTLLAAFLIGQKRTFYTCSDCGTVNTSTVKCTFCHKYFIAEK